MPIKDYLRPLNESELEWLCVRIATEKGKVTAFTVQYETTIHGERVPVVRFDTAHGFPHRDVLDRRGRVVDKVRLASQPNLGAALTYALKPIQDSGPRYRRAFFQEEQ